MTQPQCPLPNVEEALAPYINTRDKTTRIRQILTQSLKTRINDGSEPNHLTLSSTTPSFQAKDSALPSDGLYKQYLQALVAHKKAQERYDAVKEELNELLQKDNDVDLTPSKRSSDAPANPAQEYAKLLRQRRQRRKLEIIQDALTRLLDTEPDPMHIDIKFAVREELGEPPQPPVGSFNVDGDANSQIADLTFQLKKELLIAKNKFAAAKSEKAEAEQRYQTANGVDESEKVSILRDARDELISWVEGELAKIPEDEVEASQAEISFLGDEDEDENGPHISNDELTRRVGQLYEEYVAARQRYIASVEGTLERSGNLQQGRNAKAGAPSQSQTQLQRRTTFSANQEQTQTLPEASQILPYLTSISTMSKDEALLQQQTSHLRRQLILANDETNNVVQRLAGESLLVPQNSNSMSAWAKAAEETESKTKEAVMEQIKDGEASINNARMVLESLRTRRKALESLKRDM